MIFAQEKNAKYFYGFFNAYHVYGSPEYIKQKLNGTEYLPACRQGKYKSFLSSFRLEFIME